MFLYSDTQPNADIAYLYSAVVRDALKAKFNTLFGRQPVATAGEALHVDNVRVPDMITGSVDQEVAKMLSSSAVQKSKDIAGELSEENNKVLLYTVLDDNPANVSLDGIEEYKSMDKSAVDATVSDLGTQSGVNIKDGIVYLSPDLSTIEIGVYIDTQLFAQEFQYRLKNSGGNTIKEDDKVRVFDELFNQLPGSKPAVTDIRNELLAAVGLQASPEASDALVAPGPQPEPKPVE